MSLRAKVLIIVGLTLLFLSVAGVAVVRLTVLPSFETVERNLAKAHTRRALKAIHEDLAKLCATAGDWGAWDDTHEFLSGNASDYVSRNVNAQSIATIDLDFMVFLDNYGRIVHAAALDKDRTRLTAPPDSLLRTLENSKHILTHTGPDDVHSGLIAYPAGVAQIASSPVTDSMRSQPISGSIVVGRHLGERRQARLTDTIGAEVCVRLLEEEGKAQSPFTDAPIPSEAGVHVCRSRDDRLAACMTLHDINGREAIHLCTISPRDLMYRGRASVRFLSLILVLVSMGALVALAGVLERWVMSPLSRIADNIDRIAESGDAARRLPVHGNDELGRVPRGVNRMLEALDETGGKLRRSEERLRAIFESVPAGIMIVEEETQRIVDVNEAAARMIGDPRQDIVGRICHEYVCPFQEGNCPVKESGGHCENAERILLRSDGGQVPILKSVRPFVFSGKPCFLETFLDMRELKEAEEHRARLEVQLAQAQKMDSLHIMAGSIAHHFNNMMQAVLGNQELLKMDLEEGTPQRDCLEAAEVAALRAAELSSLMLTYVGQGGHRVEAVELSQLVAQHESELKAALPETVELQMHLAQDMPTMQGDPDQLRQAIDHLVRNAVEAVSENDAGRVVVRTEMTHCSAEYLQQTYLYEDQAEGDYAVLEVSDNGCGMSAQTCARAFDPYFTTHFSGRGLGLAVVLGVVRAHKGAIMLYSEPGHGTRIKALLPVRIGARAEGPKTPPWHGRGTILLVDDDVSVRAVGRTILQQLGFRVRLAADGPEALAIVRESLEPSSPEEAPVCILLDLILPGPPGNEVLQEIRNLSADLPVVLSSGYNPEELAERFADAGFTDFIQKPYVFDRLTRVLQRILG